MLRLHMNENTAGCAPAVLSALHAMTREAVARYPDYDRATDACARALGVTPAHLVLTNGLDDGLHAASNRARTFGSAARLEGRAFEAIVIEPAFEMFAAAAEAADADVVRVEMGEGFRFPLDEVLAAITPRTRIVFVNDPNNPTGQGVEPGAIERIAAAARHAIVLVDEAYADFSGRTLVGPALDRHPNLVVGRTFAKSHGLAGLRIGALVGHTELIETIRRRQPPYHVNAFAVAALVAALAAPEYAAWFVDQAARSRELIYDWSRRRGLAYWRSEANFVLVRIGPAASDVTAAAAARGVLIRDKSAAPRCEGCVRLAAGVVEHTERALATLDAVLGSGA